MRIRQSQGSTTKPDYGDWWQASDGKWYPRTLHPGAKAPSASEGARTSVTPRPSDSTGLFSGASLEDWFRFFGWATLIVIWVAAAGTMIGLINLSSSDGADTSYFFIVFVVLLLAGPFAALPWFAVAQALNYLRRMTSVAEQSS